MKEFYCSVLLDKSRYAVLVEMELGIETFEVDFFQELPYIRKNGFFTNKKVLSVDCQQRKNGKRKSVVPQSMTCSLNF